MQIMFHEIFRLNFHENIRFIKKQSQHQEQPYPLEKTIFVFLDPPKNMYVTFAGYSCSI